MINFNPLAQIANALVQNIFSNSFVCSPSPKYNPQFNGWQSASEMPLYNPIQKSNPLPPHPKKLPPLSKKANSNQYSPARNHHQSLQNKKQKPSAPTYDNPRVNVSHRRQARQTRNKSFQVNNCTDNMKYYNIPVPYVEGSSNNKEENNKRYRKLEWNPNDRLQFQSREKHNKQSPATNGQTPERLREKERNRSMERRQSSRQRITASQMDKLLQ